jgi:predicted nucleic acid-binding protein
MPSAGLIDTGAILALVDRDDAWHTRCVAAYNGCHLPLLTTEAVLTEVFHLIRRNAGDSRGVWRLFDSGALCMCPLTNAELPQIHALMDDYADRPMDFADATLVHLAGRESLNLILTIDHDDFETYRIGGQKKFSILPSRRAT